MSSMESAETLAERDARVPAEEDEAPFFLGFTKYQSLVLFAAWLGWGFDLFDSLLFTYAAPSCIPYLLAIDGTTPEGKAEIAQKTAILTSLLLIGWAVGGLLFGILTDKLGRAKSMFLTIATYSIATALCAASPNIWWLGVFRFVSALGIGGEWAAGASLVSETLPFSKRVLGGVLLYTAAPLGALLGWAVNFVIQQILPNAAAATGGDNITWRVVFASALIPTIITVFIRHSVKEPPAWLAKPSDDTPTEPEIKQIFGPHLRRRTLGSIGMAILSLTAWWITSTFIPVICMNLASSKLGLSAPKAELRALITQYTAWASILFYIGAVAGTLSVYPLSKHFSRLNMFRIAFVGSSICMAVAFAPFAEMPAFARILALFPVGFFITAPFAIFIFYLPEQFPTHLRGTGSGITYNSGRVITAIFPFVVGQLIEGGADPLSVVFYAAGIPILTLIFSFTGIAIETEHLDMYSPRAQRVATTAKIESDFNATFNDRAVPVV